MLIKDYNNLRNKVLDVCTWKRYAYYGWFDLIIIAWMLSMTTLVALIIIRFPMLKSKILSVGIFPDAMFANKLLIIVIVIAAVSLGLMIWLSKFERYKNWTDEFERERSDEIKKLISEELKKDAVKERALSFLQQNFKVDMDELSGRVNRNYTVVLMSSLVTAITSIIGNFIDAIAFAGEEGHELNSVSIISSLIVIVVIAILELRKELWKAFGGGFRLDNLKIAYFLCDNPNNFGKYIKHSPEEKKENAEDTIEKSFSSKLHIKRPFSKRKVIID